MPQTFTSLLNNFFDDFSKRGELSRFTPSVNISESDKAYQMSVEVPGMKKEDFKVEMDGNALQVSGERSWKKEDKDKTYHRVESQYGTFIRTFQLPEDANPEKISANYSDGILTIFIPKDENKSVTKRIEVK